MVFPCDAVALLYTTTVRCYLDARRLSYKEVMLCYLMSDACKQKLVVLVNKKFM